MSVTAQITGKRMKGRYPVTTADGEKIFLPSVTTVLQVVGKPALINWAANQERTLVTDVAATLYENMSNNGGGSRMKFVTSLAEALGTERAHQRQLTKAGDIGTAAHRMVEWTLREMMGIAPGPRPELSKPSEIAFQAWCGWRDGVNLEPDLIEQRVFSLKDGYAGTMDFYGRVNGVTAIIDWKTSSGIYPEAKMQLAAYRAAFIEMQPDRLKPNMGMIVRLPKKEGDTLEVAGLDILDLLNAKSAFESAHKLWKWLQEEK